MFQTGSKLVLVALLALSRGFQRLPRGCDPLPRPRPPSAASAALLAVGRCNQTGCLTECHRSTKLRHHPRDNILDPCECENILPYDWRSESREYFHCWRGGTVRQRQVYSGEARGVPSQWTRHFHGSLFH